MLRHNLTSLLVVATVLLLASFVTAFPAFVPVKQERSPYGGTAPSRRKTGNGDVLSSRSQSTFDPKLAAEVSNVASKYPVNYRSNVSDHSLWNKFQSSKGQPEAVRGKTGASSLGPSNSALDRANPDTFAPPSTDHGDIPESRWPFSLSHNRLQNGGWARNQNNEQLPTATISGVDMRLEAGAIREMHWHSESELSWVLEGTVRFGIIDETGQNYVADLNKGDMWIAPSGLPHYIQAISPGGAEFALMFNSGDFSEDDTLLLTDFLAHIPREALVKNFPGMDNKDFSESPSEQLYIFPSEVPAANNTQQVSSPAGPPPNPYVFHFSDVKPTKTSGGSVKIMDSRNFPANQIFALAEVIIEPGAMRETHWHPSSAEWDLFIEGDARMTIFAGNEDARTFDYHPGDVGIVAKSNGHYIENIGTTPVKYLEVFREKIYSDISLSNWLALTPPEVVKAHLGFNDTQIDKLQKFKTKQYQVVQ